MPPFPLLRRLDFDDAHGLKNFLVNTHHGMDFAATRDRTTPKGGLWTFKRCGHELEPDEERRGRLCLLFVHIFGRIDAVYDVGAGLLVRLRCPSDVSCRVQALYLKQIELLRSVILHEAVAAVFHFTMRPHHANEGPEWRSAVVLVRLSDKFRDPGVVVHDDAEMIVGMTRVQGEDRRDLSHAYHIRHFGARALATANYGEDYMPTRQQSLPALAGSLFTFKDLSPSTSEVPPTDEERGYLHIFQCLAFGEVEDDTGGVAIELCCPKNASCAVVELYLEQIQSLQNLIDSDAVGAPGTCKGTFFGSPTSNAIVRREENVFWVYVRPFCRGYGALMKSKCPTGKTIDILTTFERVDTTVADTNAIEMTYRVISGGSVADVDGDVPRRSVPYTCDRLTVPRQFPCDHGDSAPSQASLFDSDGWVARPVRLDTAFPGPLVATDTVFKLNDKLSVDRAGHCGRRAPHAAGDGIRGARGSRSVGRLMCHSTPVSPFLLLPRHARSYEFLWRSSSGERACTVDGGSLYLLKRIPEVLEYGTREYKGTLANYTGQVIGQVDELFSMPGVPEVLLRLRLPADASCAAATGGSTKESFFDFSATYPAITPIPHSFYVAFETSPPLTNALRRHATVVMKVSISRQDKTNRATGETERVTVGHVEHGNTPRRRLPLPSAYRRVYMRRQRVRRFLSTRSYQKRVQPPAVGDHLALIFC
ncbi:hypothetical protein DFH06DRAFT_1131889 [Mycena polygramma]|nr:hypothetical protein DFH06DRAFT_1131889 [Mycena polygramma]